MLFNCKAIQIKFFLYNHWDRHFNPPAIAGRKTKKSVYASIYIFEIEAHVASLTLTAQGVVCKKKKHNWLATPIELAFHSAFGGRRKKKRSIVYEVSYFC